MFTDNVFMLSPMEEPSNACPITLCNKCMHLQVTDSSKVRNTLITCQYLRDELQTVYRYMRVIIISERLLFQFTRSCQKYNLALSKDRTKNRHNQ